MRALVPVCPSDFFLLHTFLCGQIFYHGVVRRPNTRQDQSYLTANASRAAVNAADLPSLSRLGAPPFLRPGEAAAARGGRVGKVFLRAQSDSGPPACEGQHLTPPGSGRGGAGRGGVANLGAWPTGEDGNPSLRVAAEPGSRISMFSGVGLLESAGEKTRRPEAFAFFDARARDAAVVGRAPGEERPKTEPLESLRPHLAQSPSLGPPRRSFRGHGVSAPQL